MERISLPATGLTTQTHLFLFVLPTRMYILQKVDVTLGSKSIAILCGMWICGFSRHAIIFSNVKVSNINNIFKIKLLLYNFKLNA